MGQDREIFMLENERLKNSCGELEKELSDVQNAYERDKALWTNKFTFLEQQKEQAKNDQKESQRKFEMTIEQLQKKSNVDKDKYENSSTTML